MPQKLSTTALICAAIGLVATVAQAHPRLRMSNPSAGATLSASPTKITMRFNEGLIGLFTGLELKDARGRRIRTGPAIFDPDDDDKLIVPIKERLTPGVYNIAWHAVGIDTNRTTGQYSFKVVR